MPTLTMDAPTRRLVIVVKQLFDQGVVFSTATQSIVRRTMAVIAFDLATETLLGVASNALDPKRRHEKTFPALLQSCEDSMTAQVYGPLPHRSAILHVHDVRNDAQHKAKPPSETSVGDCRAFTRDFLGDFVDQIWGESFANLRLAELVRDRAVRTLLIDAETKLAEGDRRVAAEKAASALAEAEKRTRKAIVGARPDRSRGYDRDLVGAIQTTQETVLYLALGLNLPERVSYRRIVGDALTSPYVVGGLHPSLREQLTVDEAQFVVTYATNTVIQIEETVGDLDKPFRP